MATFDFITSTTITGQPKQDTDGVGIIFNNTTGTTVTITQLGRWVMPGNTQPHLIGIYETSAFSSPAASVTVNTAGAPANDYVYGTLTTPYVVAIGASVRIISSEVYFGGGDLWYGLTALTFLSNPVTTTNIGSCTSASVAPGSGVIGNLGQSGTSLGPVAFRYTTPEASWNKVGTVYTITGPSADAMYSTKSAIADASPGDTINMPAGTFTVGALYGRLTNNKAIAVNGAGEGVTILNMAPGVPEYEGGSALLLSGGGSFSNFTLNNQAGVSASDDPTAIIASTVNGWRIHHVTINSGPYVGYGIFANAFGLYDHVTINGGDGNEEWVFVKTPVDSWTTPNSLGGPDAVYGEDNTYNIAGYTDLNSGARGTVRFSRINPSPGVIVKLDGHGYSTNGNPRQGVRHQEFYHNVWSGSMTFSQAAIEIRGGGGRIFGNRASSSPAFSLRDYGYATNGTNWGVYQTPVNYPLFNQIGTGQWVDISVTALVPYQRCQINFIGDTVWTAIGGPASPSTNGSSANSQFTATGPGTGTGRVWICPATEPMYLWDNIKNTATTPAVWTRGSNAPHAAAITLYKSQTGNPAATFTEKDIIKANRDFFGPAGFDTEATGMEVGDADTFAGTTAVGKTGQGFWVTNEGNWNKTFAGTKTAPNILAGYLCRIVSVGTTNFTSIGAVINSAGEWFKATGPGTGTGTVEPLQGRLYVSNGATWDLDYEPYTYPHPLQGTSPTQISATINAAGNTLTVVWSEDVENGGDGGNGITLSASGGAITAAYSSGSGTDTYVYSLTGRTIQSGEIITDAYVQPGDGIKSTATDQYVQSFSGASVTNGSAINGGMATGLRAFAGLGAGF